MKLNPITHIIFTLFIAGVGVGIFAFLLGIIKIIEGISG